MVVVFLLLVGGCTMDPGPFHHHVTTGSQPWSHKQFDNADEKVSFAIFADLTGGERERIFETAVAQLNLLRPELIVNVGDLIEGGSDDVRVLHRQWDDFDARADRAQAPVFYAGGNHDLTGERLRAVWKERLGPRYYHFIYRKLLFLVLDTEDNSLGRMREIEQARTEAVELYKTGGKAAFANTEYASMPERISGTVGAEQAAYFRQAVADHPDVWWTFVLMHKPAWQRENEPNFSSIETAMGDRPYTVFYGHTHRFQYQQRFGRDYINLATTGGEQFPEKGRSMDHLMWVTVDKKGTSIANLLMEGILDKTASVPLDGNGLVFEKTRPE